MSEFETIANLYAGASLSHYQRHVWSWCQETFEGVAAWNTTKERSYRFFEEAAELFQSLGLSRDDAIKVIDYVYGRPIGETSQEIGGVMITLLALGGYLRLEVNDCLKNELYRIIQPEIQAKIREKQLAKNQAFL